MKLISLSLNFLVAGLLTASVVLAISTAPARADDQSEFKEKFKAGCESSNGSFVEAPDGQYRCNAPSGDVNKCFPDTPPHACVHINSEDCRSGC